MSRRARSIASAGIAIVVGLGGGSLTALAHHVAAEKRLAFPPLEDVAYLPSTTALRVGSLGHNELLADLLYIRTVLYFSTELAGDRKYDLLDQSLDAIIALDPHFRAPYLFGSGVTMYNGNQITNAMVMSSSHFCEAGRTAFPADWELPFREGCNYLYELKSDDPKQKEAWRRKGGELIRHAALLGGGPAWLPGLAAKIMTQEGQADAAVRYLEESYLSAQDDKTREEIAGMLLAARAANVTRLTAARDEFEAARQKELPYAPADLFVLVGEQPSPRLDLPWLTTDEVLVAAEREELDAVAKAREQHEVIEQAHE